MRTVTHMPAQLRLVAEYGRRIDDNDPMSVDEIASLMTAAQGRLVEVHELTGMPWCGPHTGGDAA